MYLRAKKVDFACYVPFKGLILTTLGLLVLYKEFLLKKSFSIKRYFNKSQKL